MADNYLERRMEEHRASRMAPRSSNRPAPLRPGRVIVDYPPFRLLVTNGDSPEGLAVIKGFIAMKCPVSFTVADAAKGPAIAQATGARYIPGTRKTAINWHHEHGDQVQAIIDLTTRCITTSHTFPIDPAAITAGPQAIASWCIFALHPSNSWLTLSRE